METSKNPINPSTIVNILTLRYDSNISPNLPKKSWKDFVPDDEPPKLQLIDELISKKIKQTDEKYKQKKISITIRGCEHSTLILSSNRKTYT